MPISTRACFFSLAISTALTAAAAAQTAVFTGNIPPSPWTPAGSPYQVLSSVTIPFPLTVQAGVRIEVHGPHTITAGALTVAGTAAAPVTIRAGGPATSWRSLILRTASSLQHCQVEDATEAGVQILAVGVTLTGCMIHRNRSASPGGGIRVAPEAAGALPITLEDCWILDNSATSHGGGLAAALPAGVTLSLVDCHITRNRANPGSLGGNFHGGGVYATGEGTIDLRRCDIRDNHAVSVCHNCNGDSRGGGLLLLNAVQALHHCVVRNNSVTMSSSGNWSTSSCYGGGLFVGGAAPQVTIEDCLFACNLTNAGADSFGGALYVDAGTVDLSHTTFARNRAQTYYAPRQNAHGSACYAGGGTVTAADCIVDENTLSNPAGQHIAGSPAPVFTHSCIQGGYPGMGNIPAPAFFANIGGCGAADLAIVSTSPCVDAGTAVPTNNDQNIPPGLGGPRGDMGFSGGPRNGGWARSAAPFALAIHPPAAVAPATVSLDLAGGRPGEPAAVVLSGVNRIPYGPFWLPGLFGLVSLASAWTEPMPIPNLLPALFTSVEFTGVTLRGGALLVTAPVSFLVR